MNRLQLRPISIVMLFSIFCTFSAYATTPIKKTEKEIAAPSQELIRKAEAGDRSAQKELSSIISARAWRKYVSEIEPVLNWTKKAAAQNDAESMMGLAYQHVDGRLIVRDIKEAVRLYESALRIGLSGEARITAALELGKIYASGSSGKFDYLAAAKWWKVAAEAGHPWAAYFLAGLYFYGNGVKQDYAEAYFWIYAGRAFPPLFHASIKETSASNLSSSQRQKIESDAKEFRRSKGLTDF